MSSEVYYAPTGYYEVQLNLGGRQQFWTSTKPTSVLDFVSLCQPVSLPSLNPGDESSVTIDDFLFAIWSPGEKTIEAHFDPLDYDTTDGNNSGQMTMTFLENPDPFNYCFGRAWAVIHDWYFADGADGEEGWALVLALKDMGECTGADLECFSSALARLIVELAKSTHPELALLESIARAFEALPVCWDAVVDLLEGLVDALFKNGWDVNFVAVESPAYVRVETVDGKQVGFLDNGTIINQVDGGVVWEAGGKKFVVYPGRSTSKIRLKGTGEGDLDSTVRFSQGDFYGTI